MISNIEKPLKVNPTLATLLSREAQLFVGWVSALRNIIGRWVSCFNPTYVHLVGLIHESTLP